MATKTLRSFSSFHRLVPSIIRRLNEDQGLAMRALANPILAIEELGITLAPSLQKEVERRLRFSEKDGKRLEALEAEIHKHAGTEFDPESGKAVEEVLFKRLKVKRPKDLEIGDVHGRGLPRMKALKGPAKGEKDPLETLGKAHPILAPLMEYRRIAKGRPGFAGKEEYERLKTTKLPLSVSGIRIDVPSHEEDHHA